MNSKNTLPSKTRNIFPGPETQLRKADQALSAARGLKARFDLPGPSLDSLHEHEQLVTRYSSLKREIDTQNPPFEFDDANAAWRQFEDSSEEEM